MVAIWSSTREEQQKRDCSFLNFKQPGTAVCLNQFEKFIQRRPQSQNPLAHTHTHTHVYTPGGRCVVCVPRSMSQQIVLRLCHKFCIGYFYIFYKVCFFTPTTLAEQRVPSHQPTHPSLNISPVCCCNPPPPSISSARRPSPTCVHFRSCDSSRLAVPLPSTPLCGWKSCLRYTPNIPRTRRRHTKPNQNGNNPFAQLQLTPFGQPAQPQPILFSANNADPFHRL